MLELCAFLGLIVNFPKSNLTPSQEFVFLGIHFQMVLYICHLSTDKWKWLLMLLHHARNSSSLCNAVDEAHRHTDIDGLSDALGQIASETDTTQFSQSLEQKKTISVSAVSTLAKRSASSELVVSSIERSGRPYIGAIHERSDDLHRCVTQSLGSSH